MGLALASTGSSTLHNDNEPNWEFFYCGNQQSQLQQIGYFELLSSRVMMRLIERWWILWYRDVDDVWKVCIIAQTVGKCNMKTYQNITCEYHEMYEQFKTLSSFMLPTKSLLKATYTHQKFEKSFRSLKIVYICCHGSLTVFEQPGTYLSPPPPPTHH